MLIVHKLAAGHFTLRGSPCLSGGLMTQLDNRGTGSHSGLEIYMGTGSRFPFSGEEEI